ncbi:type II toxin-antitoxin system HicB family antitoxin [Candidatus Parcubacteria bacterium]|nr:type II toxin-antitoxin system HicB family antitoxin [Candidatus Parcubacteria bacterium]NCS99907.1 type II toxin-antitoxin system HicB family antitoxin [Candidatus Parcubacteria bacterium]
MKKIIQAHIYQGEKYYIAECFDLPVVTQGKTLDELISNLKEAIELQLEGENLANFDLAAEPSIMASIEVDSLIYAKA